MISTELREIILACAFSLVVFLLRDQYGPGVAWIGAHNHVMVKECLDASGAAEHRVDTGLVF